MTGFDARSEYPLATQPGTPNWAENFVMMFGDPQTGIAGFCHIGTWSLDTSVWRERLAIVLPDKSIVAAMSFGRGANEKAACASFCTFEITEPGKRAKIVYDGPASIYGFDELLRIGMVPGKTSRLTAEVEFEADTPLWNMHSGGSDSTALAGGLHTEQLGKASGRIAVDASHFTLDEAYSCRDHSRGPRDVSRYRNHSWINGRFPSGFAFYCYVLRTLADPGIAMSRAVIFDNGVQYDAEVRHVEFVESINDHGRLHSLILASERGESVIKVEKVVATIPMSFSAPFNPAFGASRGERVNRSFDEAVILSCSGEHGVGWSERGFCPPATA